MPTEKGESFVAGSAGMWSTAKAATHAIYAIELVFPSDQPLGRRLPASALPENVNNPPP